MMSPVAKARNILVNNIRPSSVGLRGKTLKNTAWSSLSMIVKVMLTILTVPVLARLLSPEDFGIVALATLVTEIVALFGEFGLQAALIQKKYVYRRDLETAFWSEIGLALALAFLVIAISPFASEFFDSDALSAVLWISAAGLLVTSTTVVHKTVMARTMNFKALSIIEIGAAVVRNGVALVLAFLGHGYWSLVYAALAGFIASALMRFFYFPWLPRLSFSRRSFLRLFKFGRNILGDNFLNYLSNNVDNMIIGKKLGAESLGFYHMAFTFPDMIRKNVQQLLSRVLFPAYSRVQDEGERMRSGFEHVIQLISVIVFPVMAGFAAVAPLFVPLYFGNQWTSIVLPVQLLCLAAASRTIMAMCGPAVHAVGRPDVTMRLSLVRLPLLIVVIMLGIQWGLVGVAASIAVFSVFWMFVFIYFTCRLIDMQISSVLTLLQRSFFPSICMFLFVWLLNHSVLAYEIPKITLLVLEVVMGFLSYAIFSYFYNRNSISILLNLAKAYTRK